MQKVKKTAEVLRDIAANKQKRELDVQRRIASGAYSASEVDMIFDGFGPVTTQPQGQVSEALVRSAFGAYEPNKYEYRVNPENGNLQRKAK